VVQNLEEQLRWVVPGGLHQQKKGLLRTDRHCVRTQEIRLEHPVRPARSQIISKKINLRPAASCPPCAPDVAGAYNVNSSSGCGRPRRHGPDVVGVRLDARDATRSCPPQQPCALRTTLPSRYTPCTPLHATPFLTSGDFNLLLHNKPYNPLPTGFPPMLLCSVWIPS